MTRYGIHFCTGNDIRSYLEYLEILIITTCCEFLFWINYFILKPIYWIILFFLFTDRKNWKQVVYINLLFEEFVKFSKNCVILPWINLITCYFQKVWQIIRSTILFGGFHRWTQSSVRQRLINFDLIRTWRIR